MGELEQRAGGLGVCRGSRDSEGVIAATQVCRSALCCPCPLSTHRPQPPGGAGGCSFLGRPCGSGTGCEQGQAWL